MQSTAFACRVRIVSKGLQAGKESPRLCRCLPRLVSGRQRGWRSVKAGDTPPSLRIKATSGAGWLQARRSPLHPVLIRFQPSRARERPPSSLPSALPGSSPSPELNPRPVAQSNVLAPALPLRWASAATIGSLCCARSQESPQGGAGLGRRALRSFSAAPGRSGCSRRS